MAILINDNYSLSANKAFDARYLDVTTPWADCAAAIAGIPTYRYQGLTVNIAGEEYWWKDGLTDGDLVPKALGGTSNLSGATNGLSLYCGNTYVGLGGILTQDTTICGEYALNLGNVASGLTALCGVTPIFHIEDDGTNSSISFNHDQNTPHFDVCLFAPNANSNAEIVLDVDNTNGCFIASTAPNTICCSSLSLNTTDDNVAIYNAHSSNADMHYIKEACIASSKLSCEALINRTTPTDNIKTIMNYDDRSHTFIKDDSIILSVLSGGTARYGSNVSLSNDCDLVHKYYVDNTAGNLSASNGLTRVDSNITLGGGLTGNTTVDGAFNLEFGSFGGTPLSSFGAYAGTFPTNATIFEMSQCDITYAIYVSSQSAGFTFQPDEMRVIDDINNKGLVYFQDYCSNFTCLSIPNAGWVTGQTSTSGVQTANNGLTKIGTNVTLGGDLTGNTTINGTGSHNMTLNNINDLSFSNINDLSLFSASATTCATDNMLIRTPKLIIHNGVNNVVDISSSCNIFTDATNSEGFVYAAEYCGVGKTNPRWIPDNAYVTGLTTGSISTASNGLTLIGTDVVLGGTLTDNTDICLSTFNLNIENSGVTTHSLAEFNPTTINLCAGNVNSPFQISKITADYTKTLICNGYVNCYSALNMSNALLGITICGTSNASFIVTDDSTTPRGIEYATGYSATFSDCSLITKEYSNSGDTATLASGKTYTDNCALITLGSANTYTDNCALITLNSGKTYTDNCAGITLGSANTYTDNCALITLNSGKTYTDNCAGITLGSANTYTDNCAATTLSSANTYTDNCATTTLSSANTYTDNCALTTLNSGKTYTDNCAAACTITASNGLTKTGNNIILTGALTQASGFLGDGHDFQLGTSTRKLDVLLINSSGGTTISNGSTTSSYVNLLTTNASIGISDSSNDGSSIVIGETCMVVTDEINSKGLEYADNYCGNYTARSIPDVGWVTGQTSSSGIHSASNGLCKVGTNVKLGGGLLENTSITGATYQLSIGVNEFIVSGTNCTEISGDRGTLYMDTCETRLSSYADVTNFSDICLDQQGIKVTVCGTDGHMYYADDYSSTYDERSIVDKDYIDNKANVVAVNIINNTYTTLRNDELIGVSGLSTNEISLYAAPVLGQRLTVVDICGNALGDPIIVNGNGNNINDAICSTINTDYGSVTYVYNGMFWSAVAFIN